MKRFNLPARVRVSELSTPPGESVLNQLKKLGPGPAHTLEQLRLEGARLEPGRIRMAVALAGGSPVGYALLVEGKLSVVVPASWRGKGIEAALEGTLQPDPLETDTQNSGAKISSSESIFQGARVENPIEKNSGDT